MGEGAGESRSIEITKSLRNIFKPERIPAYIALQNTVENLLSASSDGFTFSDLYKMMPNIDPRRVREAIQTLEAKSVVHHEKCRCGSASVYYKS